MGGFYNTVFGYNIATLLVLPMLGRNENEWPGFRDCFLYDLDHPEFDGKIHIFTRTGGGNRKEFRKENDKIRKMQGFITDYDDGFDATFASWIFDCSEEWEEDFEKIKKGLVTECSSEYREFLGVFYPVLYNYGILECLFKGELKYPGQNQAMDWKEMLTKRRLDDI